MIRHMVLFTLNDDISTDDDRVRAAVAGSAALRAEVPGGSDWVIDADLSGRDIAADFAGVGDFASTHSLADFLAHPQHRAAGQRWAEIASWVIADIEIS